MKRPILPLNENLTTDGNPPPDENSPPNGDSPPDENSTTNGGLSPPCANVAVTRGPEAPWPRGHEFHIFTAPNGNSPPDEDERYRTALRFLEGRINYERVLSIPYLEMGSHLERLERALTFLGRPDRRMRVIHIAGTKGKGSVAMMIEKILRDQGARTGLFTSPHLFRIEERFALDGSPSPPGDLADVLLDLKGRLPSFEESEFSFFEIAVLAAFLLFAKKGVDFAILETGLGGRLDATNICRPDVTVITSVSYDHQKQLGATLPEIAAEKGGIVKRGVPVVSGIAAAWDELPTEAEIALIPPPFRKTAVTREAVREADRVLRQTAKNRGAPLIPVDRLDPDIRSIPLRTVGSRQPWNVQTALTILDVLKKRGIFHGDRRQAVASLTDLTLPARGEIVSQRPLCLIDGAHNRAGVAALAESVDQRWPDYRKTLIFAAMNGKDVEGMFWELFPRFDSILLTSVPHSPRSLSAAELDRIAETILPYFPDGESIRRRIEIVEDIQPRCAEILNAAVPKTEEGHDSSEKSKTLFCFTGSFYFVSYFASTFASALFSRGRFPEREKRGG